MSTPPGAASPYPQVDAQPDLPALEREVIAYWADDGTFAASVEQRPAGENGSNEFVFYDGPPFANGLPHYGHVLTGYVKDVIPRFQTMRGRRVERRFGWDCHGLPAEMLAEKELGLANKVAIADYGIAEFNDYCRTSVIRYTREWEHYVTRQARWVDFRNDYKTMDLPYMESVMWALKQLWAKGLLYEGHRVLPYCWECETPLSNFETRLDDATRDRQDPAITVLFELETGENLLVWTTTPWTLPSNLALAVGPDIDYAVFDEAGRRYILGAATVDKYEPQLANATPAGTVKGRDLVGRSYAPLFPYFSGTENGFRVLAADFVDTDEGTGVVHIAPGFGEEDRVLGAAHSIPVLAPVDGQGRFTGEVTDYAGQQVFDANPHIIRDLKDRGVLVRHDSYVHAYPHCWRTETPLIYKAVSSFFVNVSAIRERMLELNQQIAWVPEHVKDGAFGKGLESAPDWSISRNRFWGSPIPVWKSDDPNHPRVDVYGSLDELERDFGVRPTDLHRPAIDELTRPNPDDPTGKSTMRRVEDVLDCWFESGSMPFAQVHYPFESQEWFEHHFPGDFIVEYIAQTRGWFYTLHVLATALFDRPAFRSCLVHGVILDDEGQKLSKRSRNYTDPLNAFERVGSDAVRWFLMASPILRGGDLVITERAIVEATRRVLIPLWNAWHFFALYANADGYRATPRADAEGILDRYILAKTGALNAAVGERLEAYDLYGACEAIERFIDALNNWYIRRSRDRFWRSDTDAFDTLAHVLRVVSQVVAPVIPMVAEALYRGLTGERSVHLTDWPEPEPLAADADLVRVMDRVRDVCSAAHSIRREQKRRVRLPLPRVTVAAPDAEELERFADLIRDETNVKKVDFTPDVARYGSSVLRVNAPVVGPRLGDDMQKVMRAAREGVWSDNGDGTIEVGGHTLEPGDFELRLAAVDPASSRALPGNTGLVVLDLAVTPELETEGTARDVVRLVQSARRDEGLHVSDRIRLSLVLPDDVRDAVDIHRDYVTAETLAVELVFVDALSEGHRGELPDGRAVRIGVAKVGQ